ncbi:putative MFS transporter [Zopfia rhizophila CBS 207.26]|uniref:Putative MFS transporter n=1 Tax=Zopfia rhizophila CBS 207.26 TaxID=1314779 RepID=A0A6A6E1T8_9PEZI|nr:putative MFS transporter [Zopfia rhizophila CBS 207.26]
MSSHTTTVAPFQRAVPPNNDRGEPEITPAVLLQPLDGEQLTNIASMQPHWNQPRINTWRLVAVFITFFNLGANDASYGLETYYHLNYTVVSLIFLSPFAGYFFAAASSDKVHMQFGQRGVAIIGPLCRLASYITFSLHPPWPVVVVILIFNGYGNGILDAGWNAWVGNMIGANQLLGIMHGFYGLGAVVSPLIATAMITKAALQWYTFFYVMCGLGVLELVSGTWAFWEETGAAFRRRNTNENGQGRLRAALKHKVTWICSLFLLLYVGCEVSIAGWIVTFMIRIRKGEPFASGITATGFWLGITLGRVSLGFLTPKLGERLSVSFYLVIGVGLELLFWLVPNFIVSAIAVAFLGFFLGPMFPASIIAATKLLPQHMHVAAIGFCSAVGGGGAAIVPFAVGAIAQVRGVETLEPIVLALLVLLLGTWLTLPRMPRHSHQQ